MTTPYVASKNHKKKLAKSSKISFIEGKLRNVSCLYSFIIASKYITKLFNWKPQTNLEERIFSSYYATLKSWIVTTSMLQLFQIATQECSHT